jgi:hypothetical protein
MFMMLTFNVFAAQNEMGTGKPVFGIYGQAVGAEIRIFSLNDATVAFPNGCTFLTLTPATLGWETYRAALSILITAKATGASVRFYAIAPRDSGCGVDFLQLM